MDIKSQLKEDLSAAIKALYQQDFSSLITIEATKDMNMGDYSSTIAMRLAKGLGKNPLTIAQEIVQSLKSAEYKLEVAGNGFLNFLLLPQYYSAMVKEILEKQEDYGRQDYGKDQKYNIEYVSANPTGFLHIGHARQAALGDSISRLYQFVGYQVTREFYLNDCGNQVKNLGLSLRVRYHQLFGQSMELPADGYHGEDLKVIAEIIKSEIGDKYLNDFTEDSLAYFIERGVALETAQLKKDLLEYRTEFDVYTSEKSIHQQGKIEKVLALFSEKGVLYQQDGALFFASSRFGDDKDRVLIKSDGSYTYIVPDIAYHAEKMERGFDFLIGILGADHHGYLARMKAALIVLGYQPEQLDYVIVQMVRLLKDGEEIKMSKRTGRSLTIQDLIEYIGVDAARYIFTSRASNSHLDIDIDLLTKKSSENPVFYIQYAHARICSIIENAEKKGIKINTDLSLLTDINEKALLVHQSVFKEVVLDAALTRSPHKIVVYIQKLAQLFHVFYSQCRVIDENNQNLSASRLAIIKSTSIILRNGLLLIGVNAPNKM